MSILPLIPITILLGGALAVTFSRLVRFRYVDAIITAASLAALLALMSFGSLQPIDTPVSTWQPLSVFGTPAGLHVERLDWFIAVIATLVCTAAALSNLAYSSRQRFGSSALDLGMTAMLIAAVFAANLLTLALAWGLFDVFFGISALAQVRGKDSIRRTAFVIGSNVAATLCLWIAALVIAQANQSQYWHLTDLPETARTLIGVAVVLRLGLYPLSQWLSIDREDAPGHAALFYVLPALAGLHLLIRIAGLNALPSGSALIWLGALSLFAGGLLAWWRGQAQDALPYLALGGIGAVVLAGTVSDAPGVILVNGAASWALAITVFSVGRGFDRKAPWWSIGHALALATLVGLPASLGFDVRTNLAAGIASRGDTLLIAFTLIGETFLIGSIIRLAMTQAQGAIPTRRPAMLAYAIGISLAALPPFLLPAIGRSAIPELTPPSFEIVLTKLGALGGVLTVLPIIFAATLIWLRRNSAAAGWPFDLTRIIGLDWLYNLFAGLINAVARGLRAAAALIEGEGALLWALLVVIAAYVVLSGAIQ